MKIIKWEDFIKNGIPDADKSLAVTVGVFDGVHKGHKELIKKVVSVENTIPAVVTFREPAHKNERAGFLIQSFEEKAAVMETLGVEILIVVDFTDDFSRMTGTQFLETLCARASIGFFAAGANFRCGYGLDTDAKSIQDFFAARNIHAEIVPEVLYEGEPISSSRIREALAEGDMELAEALIN